MGKNGKKNKLVGTKSSDSNVKQSRISTNSDTSLFISLSRQLNEQGDKFSRNCDYKEAVSKYEKSLNLLPKNHVEVPNIRCKMADCYMNMGIHAYPDAINECNLVLESSPTCNEALSRRARCYEALNRHELSFVDVNKILKTEPNNQMTNEIKERGKIKMEIMGIKSNDEKIDSNVQKDKPRKKKSKKVEERVLELIKDKKPELQVEENKASSIEEEIPKRIKLVFGDDIRWANVPTNCTILKLREIVSDRYPNLEAVKIKYKDQEGDLITITTNEELMLAEESTRQNGTSIRFYLIEVDPDQDPFFEKLKQQNVTKKDHLGRGNWVIQFAQELKNHLGFSSDVCLDLYEHGSKLYNKARNKNVKIQESQELFGQSEIKFKEMTALALFNCGNVHMTRARKRVSLTRDPSKESLHAEVESAYKWAETEYLIAQKRYEEALKVKPIFCEGVVALGQQQFELAKLSWYYAISSHVDLGTWCSDDVIKLYNSAEENMGKGISMLNEGEEGDSKILKMEINGLMQDVATDQGNCMRSQIHLLWGTILYERSVMEYKLGLPVWQECLEVAVENFELAGASQTDIAVLIKNHCSNNTALEGFDIDEMVQAWCEMDDAKRLQNENPSSPRSSPRSEAILRRRGSKLHHALEYA